jgi:putative ABC transport system permease protein
LLKSQLVAGNLASTSKRLSETGWVAASKQIADEHHVRLGETLSLATPTGTARFRLAATTTNFGWASGAVLMNTTDYGRYWATSAPSALGVDLAPTANITRVRREIVDALGPNSGLEAVSAQTRGNQFDAIASEGLSRLGEISTLLLLAAIFAMGAALTSTIWQRRVSLAGLRLSGVRPPRLRRILLVESVLMLGAGCLTGAVAGVYGQVVLDGYLKHVTGFPVARIATGGRPLAIFAVVAVSALVIAAVPGWVASRVSPALALEDE